MVVKTAILAFVALALCGMPIPAPAADKPAPVRSSHKKSCFDAAWGSPEWKACEAKMQAQGKKG